MFIKWNSDIFVLEFLYHNQPFDTTNAGSVLGLQLSTILHPFRFRDEILNCEPSSTYKKSFP